MKDETDISGYTTFYEIEQAITNWTSYYHHERYQWDLAKLAPTEYYQYLLTGVYPLVIPNAKSRDSI